jgi:hypothetical protein
LVNLRIAELTYFGLDVPGPEGGSFVIGDSQGQGSTESMAVVIKNQEATALPHTYIHSAIGVTQIGKYGMGKGSAAVCRFGPPDKALSIVVAHIAEPSLVW